MLVKPRIMINTKYFFKTLLSKKIILDFFNYYVFTIITALIGIVSVTYLTNLLSPQEYGMIGIYNSILFFIPSIISFSVNGLQAIEIVDKTEQEYFEFRNSYIFFLLFNSLLGFFGVILFTQLIGEYIFLVYMALIMGILLSFSSIHNTELINNAKPTQFGIFSTLTQILILFFSFVFLKELNLSWKFRIYSFIIAEIIVIGIRYFFFSNILKTLKFTIRKSLFKKMYSYGIPLLFYVLLGWVLNQSDRFFLVKFFSLNEVGIYTVAAGLSSVIVMINSNLIKVLMPIIYKKLSNGTKGNYVNMITFYYSIFIFTISLFYCVFLKYYSHLFLNINYQKSLNITYIMSFSQALFGIYTTRGIVIDYYKKNTQKTLIVAICTVILIGLTFFLIPRVGYLSPVISLLLSFFLLLILTFFYSDYLLKKYEIL